MKKTNEYYELITDEDMNLKEGYQRMILNCPECGALFSEKACGNRTIFPWFGYHPEDGNCKVLTDKFSIIVESQAHKCNCDSRLIRLRTVKELTQAIYKHKEA